MTSAVLANLDGKINSIAADTSASKLNQQEHEIILLVLDINVISDTKFYLFQIHSCLAFKLSCPNQEFTEVGDLIDC